MSDAMTARMSAAKTRIERGEILHTFKYNGRTHVQWGCDGKVGGFCSLAAWHKAVKDGYVLEKTMP
jgi:hypothetical protein